MNRINFDSVLKRTGEWYIIIVIAISQVIGLLGSIPGILSVQWNVEFNPAIGQLLSSLGFGLWAISQVIVLIICWQITPNARNQITLFVFGIKEPDKEKELTAWKEITNLVTQYGVIAFFVNIVITVLVPFLIVSLRRDTLTLVAESHIINSPAPVYILLGGFAAVCGATILSMFFIGRLTIPARVVLLPKDLDTQLLGRTGTLLGPRFQIIHLTLVLITVAVMAPIGYQQVIQTLSTNGNHLQILSDLQIRFLLLSVLVILLGAGFSFFSLQSISGPIRNLIDVLQKIEQGDLSQRVPVLATDEFATVAVQFNRMITRFEEFQSSLENQVSKRTKQLAATNEVGRVASSILDPDELLPKIANLITEQFDYYYAAIYLLDASEKWVELREATGQAGNVLKQNRHRLEVTGRSMVAASIREKAPRIVQNTAEEKQHVDNPLLPYTRSEIALPLMVGNRVLGALDVQSTKPADFGTDAIETMQNMAVQVAIALENARLFQEAQQSIRELRAIQKQYLLEGWNNIRSYNEELEYGVGDMGETEHQVIESPINLRDQVFGQISLEKTDDWTPEQRSLVDAVAAQAAIALENARLVSESRQIALRERTLTEINSKIWSSPTIESILQNVIKELGKRLDTSNASIELNLDDEL
ncbi:MAG: GAF domain-containing protein [Anaerolineales bacterium]|nr:GAF domain-containing protein [Anaerolineales bacterium]